MTVSKVLLFCLLSFIGGIFIASFFKVPQIIFYEILFLGLFYSLIFFKHKAILVFAVCLLVFAFGLWQGNTAAEPEQYYTSQEGYFTFLKQRFDDVISQNLSPPQSQILSAILLGNKQSLSKEFKEKLNRAGIRHITAISGMHIVILSSILLGLGVALGLYRGQAFYFAVSVLWLFILMIGFQPSAIRAGIMGTMFLFCQKIGRQKTADRALLLTAAVMLAINPSLLRYSVGFQLSFLATLGIIYLMPIFQGLFQRLKELGSLRKERKEPSSLRGFSHWVTGLLSMSFAAQIFVLPFLIYYFGQFSVVSPLTNLLVVPLLPFLMVSGFLFVIFGALWQPLAFIFLFPVWFMLNYLTKITEFFAGLSWSTINFQLHWLWLFVVYSALGIIIWRIKIRQRRNALP